MELYVIPNMESYYLLLGYSGKTLRSMFYGIYHRKLLQLSLLLSTTPTVSIGPT